MKEKTTTLVDFANNLEQTSESVAESATNQSQAVMTASAQMQSLNANMEEISVYAANIKNNTDATNDSLQRGSVEMKELVAAMDQIASCYDEVEGFLEEIDNIASQTSLLSLNASIEAARAGEVGRGFAVVASEIQALSDSSTKASANIAVIVKKIQNTVNSGKTIVSKTQDTIEEGVNNSVENAKMIEEIVGYVEAQKSSSAGIAASLNEIAEIVEGNAACAEENSAISSQVGECAQSLLDTIGQYKLR